MFDRAGSVSRKCNTAIIKKKIKTLQRYGRNFDEIKELSKIIIVASTHTADLREGTNLSD